MKTLTAVLLLTAVNIYAQGFGTNIVSFANVGVSDDRRVWVGSVGNGTKAGAGYLIALYFAPAGTTDDSIFTQVGNAVSFLNTATTTGTFTGGSRTIIGPNPPFSNGGVVALQARAWSAHGGATYEEALAFGDGSVYIGKGRPFDMDTKTPDDLLPPPSVGAAAGWNGFAVTTIPEPSVIGLG